MNNFEVTWQVTETKRSREEMEVAKNVEKVQ